MLFLIIKLNPLDSVPNCLPPPTISCCVISVMIRGDGRSVSAGVCEGAAGAAGARPGPVHRAVRRHAGGQPDGDPGSVHQPPPWLRQPRTLRRDQLRGALHGRARHLLTLHQVSDPRGSQGSPQGALRVVVTLARVSTLFTFLILSSPHRVNIIQLKFK